MSRRVLTDFLLDFGRCFWGSPQMQEEFSGLLASGFRETGKYGIGFFSVFMVADKVKVLTRRADAATKDTLVLELGPGLTGRPILRPADKDEQLRDGGTVICLQMNVDPTNKQGLLYSREQDTPHSVADVCMRIAPALDVNLNSVAKVLRISESLMPMTWQTLPGVQLLWRLRALDFDSYSETEWASFREKAALNLRIINDEAGVVVGRACINAGFADLRLRSADLSGLVAVGGLEASSLTGICGILVGKPTRAARDDAEPLVSRDALRGWAEEQIALVPKPLSNGARSGRVRTEYPTLRRGHGYAAHRNSLRQVGLCTRY